MALLMSVYSSIGWYSNSTTRPGTWPCGRVCGLLAIHIGEIASENHEWVGTRAYDYSCALLTCQMALEFWEVGAYAHVYVPAHVFALVSHRRTSKNTPHPYLCFLSSQISFTHFDCIKEHKIQDNSVNIWIESCSMYIKKCATMCINKHLSFTNQCIHVSRMILEYIRRF